MNLTKSRFQLALSCPRKLAYVGNRAYLDTSADNSFLAALAEGGHQVGALACLYHPGGVRVDTLDSAAALAQTAELLQQTNVTVFEAALQSGHRLIRVDILRKRGNEVDLIEVKAKSYSPLNDGELRGAKGGIAGPFLPYLQDVAFQRLVAQAALPGLRVRAFLTLVNKDEPAETGGLNARLVPRRDGRRLHIDVAAGTTGETLGRPILHTLCVDAQVDEILDMPVLVAPGEWLPFAEAAETLAERLARGEHAAPTPSAACASCQFKAATWPEPGALRSGFHECWAKAFGWGAADFEEGQVLDLWSFTRKDDLIQTGVLKTKDITPEDLRWDEAPPGIDGMSRKHRQWFQCHGGWPGGGAFYFDREGFQEASRHWRYPLHCIDFETAAAALPFVAGRRPYETTAFQFSHHVLHADGRVQHQTQWLDARPGVDPAAGFVRALRDALSGDDGTIMRWAAHENTVLNHLRSRWLRCDAAPPDAAELIAFIEQITEHKDAGRNSVAGARNMVDLCKLAERHYFHPSTRGSNSLKKVLPALMRSSPFLRRAYSQPESYGPRHSLNLKNPMAWWQQDASGDVIDPYQLLPPLFDDLDADELAQLDAALPEELRDGGAAMAAYCRLQAEALAPAQRQAIEAALLRYCELDTLAMVMALQAWLDASRESAPR